MNLFAPDVHFSSISFGKNKLFQIRKMIMVPQMQDIYSIFNSPLFQKSYENLPNRKLYFRKKNQSSDLTQSQVQI